ncbi:MAG TPA: fimbria/pilus periplasmic chaperone [Vicinamibacterales bacterium]
MTHRQLSTAIAALAMILAASRWGSAQSTFSVDPLLIKLNAASNNAVLTLSNTSANDLRFEIKGFAWDQEPISGTMQLTATTDLVIFPPLVTLKAHSTQRIRVGATAAQGTVEKAYRLLIEELPSEVKPANANQVNVRTRIGVPVFVEPTKSTLSGKIDSVTIANHIVSVALANTGTTHAMVDSIVIRGMSGPDQPVFEESLPGWYVLAGKTRTWQYTFKPAQCRPMKFVEVEVYAHDKMLSSRADVPAGACAP